MNVLTRVQSRTGREGEVVALTTLGMFIRWDDDPTPRFVYRDEVREIKEKEIRR